MTHLQKGQSSQKDRKGLPVLRGTRYLHPHSNFKNPAVRAIEQRGLPNSISFKDITMIGFEKTHPDVPTPKRAHPTDAGVDLVAWSPDARRIPIRPGEREVIGTGIKVAIPQGHVGLVVVRSSTGIKRGLTLANDVGVIDSDYRGEIKVCLHNLGGKTQVVTHAERIAQLLIVPIATHPWVENDLDATGRGEGGIGSTGTH